MSKALLSRRAFLQTTAGVAGASLIGSSALLEQPAYASGQAVAPSDRVRFGIVGVGMEGSGLLTTAIQLSGVECVAACRSLRRPPRAREGDRGQADPHHAPLSGTARRQGH